MRKTSRIISILLTVAMLMGLMTSVSFAAQTLPTTFGWSAENAGYITIDVPEFDGEEVEYLLDLYKDGNKVSGDFGVFFDASGKFETEIFVNKIKELGNGTYKYKIGFERDFDTDFLVNATAFSSDYVVDFYSHSVEIKPTVIEDNASAENNTVNTTEVPDTAESTQSNTKPDADKPQAPEQEDNSPKSVIKGQLTYYNRYSSTNCGEEKPLQTASISLYKRNGIGNTHPLAETTTDLNGMFELTYKQGEYDLSIIYGESEKRLTVKASGDITDLGNIKFEPYEYTYKDSALMIPHNATTIEINEDNFNDYFEDVKIIYEHEENADRLGANAGYLMDNLCGFTVGMVNHKEYVLGEAYAYLSDKNNLWFISSRNISGFVSKRTSAFYGQSNAIYDEVNNVLYYLSEGRGLSWITSGYVVANFKDNGIMTIIKFEPTSFGNPTTYKITGMTARFKKVPYVTVSYNGEFITFDQKPIIENGRTLVPLRAIFEKIGADVEWNGDTQTVTATKDDITVSLTINNTTAYKNGEAITLDVPAKIINGRTLVPVRFVSDCFGVNVDWDGTIQKVILTK